MTNNIKLSICMIVKDEENNIQRCLNSIVKLVERDDVELIIVDTGSNDKTVEIAKQYTEKVYYHEWNNNFSDMRNISISYAVGEWLFILDADEEVEDENKLIHLIHDMDLKQFNTIVIQARNFLNSNKDTYAVNKAERFFRNDGFQYKGTIHNQPMFQQPVIYIGDVWINHYGYNNEDIKLMEKKFQRTSKILLEELKKDPKNIYYHFQLSRTYAMHKDYLLSLDEARLAYKLLKESQVESVEKKFIYVFNEYARISYELNLYEESINSCKEGLSVNPNYIDLYYYLGKSLEKLNKDEEAFKVYQDYLKLYQKYIVEGFDDIGLLEQYKLDINSQHEVKFRIAQYYYNLGHYIDALELLKDIRNNQAKILLMTKICLDATEYKKLFNYFSVLEKENEKNLVINLVEEKFKKEKDQKLISIFSEDDTLYGLLNKIRLSNELIELHKWIKLGLNKYEIENNLPLFIEIFEVMIEKNIQVIPEFKKINSAIIKNIVVSMINNPEKYNYFLNYLNNSSIRESDFQSIRVYLAIANTILLDYVEKNKDNIINDIQDIFENYLKYGGFYIIFKYGKEKINYLYRYENNKEEKFLMLMSLYYWNKKSSELGVLKYLKEASETYPYFSHFITNLIEKVKVDFQVKNEFRKIEEIKSQNQDLKILHGTIEIAGQMNTLVKGLNQISNVTALGLNYYPSYLSYGNESVLDISKVKNKEDLTKELFEASLNTFDIFHFHYNTSIMPNLVDIPLLKENNKKIFMHNWGTDIRLLTKAKQLNRYAKSKNEDELSIIRNMQYLANYIDDCIVADAELYEYVKGFYNRVHFVRQALDISQYSPNPTFQFRKTKPVIVHAPTSTDFKGTETVNAVIERLKLKYDIEYKLVQNLSHDKAKEVYRSADIIIDQLHSVGHGMLSLEAMALGKPVITSISEFMADYYPKEIPIVAANPENLEKKIELLIKDTEMRNVLGKQGREYVKKYHDHCEIAEVLMRIYNS